MIVAAAASCGLESAPPPAGARAGALQCAGQVDKVVTASDYLGAREELSFGTPDAIGHAAAAELLYSEVGPPSKERFAVAWIKASDRKVYVRRYDTYTKAFLGGEAQLSPWGLVRPWVRHLGFDDDCVAIFGETTCAWFTWADDYGDVNWRAVGAGGAMGTTRWFDGRDPSGDTGQVEEGCPFDCHIVRKKLLAFISSGSTGPERGQVKAKILDGDGSVLSEVTLYTTATGWKAYQTAVAWSSSEARWLVAWTENTYPAGGLNGRILARYVNFDGTLGPAPNPANPISYCEGNSPQCANLAIARPGGPSPRLNSSCVCKGIWLASSDAGTATDRYRLHHYGRHARLDKDGLRTALDLRWFCKTYCPLTEGVFFYQNGTAAFQQMDVGTPTRPAEHRHLIVDSFASVNQLAATTYHIPQAFRANGKVAVAVSTNGITSASGLQLSIVDVQANGCPP